MTSLVLKKKCFRGISSANKNWVGMSMHSN